MPLVNVANFINLYSCFQNEVLKSVAEERNANIKNTELKLGQAKEIIRKYFQHFLEEDKVNPAFEIIEKGIENLFKREHYFDQKKALQEYSDHIYSRVKKDREKVNDLIEKNIQKLEESSSKYLSELQDFKKIFNEIFNDFIESNKKIDSSNKKMINNFSLKKYEKQNFNHEGFEILLEEKLDEKIINTLENYYTEIINYVTDKNFKGIISKTEYNSNHEYGVILRFEDEKIWEDGLFRIDKYGVLYEWARIKFSDPCNENKQVRPNEVKSIKIIPT